MNNFKHLQSISIDQLVEFLDTNGNQDAIWWKWFDEKYCDRCEPVMVYVDDDDGENVWKTECECSYCEEHNKCRFFPEIEDVPDSKETIKLWLEAEVEDE